MRAWLKGGLISLGIYVVFLFFYIIIYSLNIKFLFFLVIPIFYLHGIEGLFISAFLLEFFGHSSLSIFPYFSIDSGASRDILGLLIYFILNTPLFFIIGSFIGWIIGKLKSKNITVQNNYFHDSFQ